MNAQNSRIVAILVNFFLLNMTKNISLDISSDISLDILIPTVVLGLVTTLVPYYWNKQKQDFQHKLHILKESVLIEKNFDGELRTFFDIINWKYRGPFLNREDIVWKMRDEPLDDKTDLQLNCSIEDKFNKVIESIGNNFLNRQNSYLQLYRTAEMNSHIDKKRLLLFKNHTLLFQISYEPKKIKSIENHLTEIQCNFSEINDIHQQILRLYMKKFRKKYWFKRSIIKFKQLFK